MTEFVVGKMESLDSYNLLYYIFTPYLEISLKKCFSKQVQESYSDEIKLFLDFIIYKDEILIDRELKSTELKNVDPKNNMLVKLQKFNYR